MGANSQMDILKSAVIRPKAKLDSIEPSVDYLITYSDPHFQYSQIFLYDHDHCLDLTIIQDNHLHVN